MTTPRIDIGHLAQHDLRRRHFIPPGNSGCTEPVISVGHRRSWSADNPLTPSELPSRNLSVADRAYDPTLHAAFVRALPSAGFNVVTHLPYHGDLEVTVAAPRSERA